ncbi:MAG: Subtilase family [Actinomycetota bacterium]|jgi:hypothetical protein|nr:Subtilase family [Actinomycetota bacterium]
MSRALVAGLVAAVVVVPHAGATAKTATAPVIAVVGESGLNVLHHDFRTPDGSTPAYPPSLGHVVLVTLPANGTFAEKRAAVVAGPLGHLQPGQVYGIRGTRLLVASAPGDNPATDVTGGGSTTYTAEGVQDETLHGTGVVDAAIGTRFGTASQALALLVLGSGADAWAWVASQPAVDVVTTSDYEVGQPCVGAQPVRRLVASGRPVFSSSGNTTDEGEQLTSPNGLAEVYQVGGVTPDGAPYGTPHQDSDPWYAGGQVTRPYQTGELYDFVTASYDSETGTMRFGGTSGATPRTAGWAARLIAHARQQRARPVRGPLADGRLTEPELVQLMRHVAVPSMSGQAGAFYAEGYGALNGRAVQRAIRVLDGGEPEPARPDDDAREAQVEQARTVAFAGC